MNIDLLFMHVFIFYVLLPNIAAVRNGSFRDLAPGIHISHKSILG